MTDSLIIVYAALVGAVIGSFLNVCIHRWPRDESVVAPRSRCPRCGNAIAWYDNVPMLSWLALRGRCRHCGLRISLRYPLVELAVALIWGGAVLAFAWGSLSLTLPAIGEALRLAVFLTVLLGIALTDAQHYIIPDEFSIGGLVIGVALSFLPGGITPMAAGIGAAVGFALLWLVAVLGEAAFRKPAMGGGDIKMMAFIGAFLGWQGVLLTIFLGSLLGALIFGPISYRTGKLVPFGIFLAIGAAVTVLWGDTLIAWYTTTILGVA
ncbi:MAG TPA: prepilin peptidase [Longimicrobiales bacterium]|nr:prepilin peptidase [Longimicrobiales bacterium]